MPVTAGKLTFWIPDSGSLAAASTVNVPEFPPWGL